MLPALRATLFGQRPALEFDFYNEAVPSLPAFSGAANGTRINRAGAMVAATAPRFDYSPSNVGVPLALLIEEAGTNSIRNNTMQGAAAGTPGTNPTNWFVTSAGGNLTTVTIVGTGTESGIAYIDIRMVASGAVTPLIQYEQNTQIAATAGQTWTDATYVRLVGGSLSNVTVNQRVQYRTSGGVNVNFQDAAIIPTSAGLATQRFTNSFLATGGTIAAVTSGVLPVFSGAGDVTLRIGLPHLSQGSSALSVIQTTSAAVTRDADLTTFAWTLADGSYAVEFDLIAVTGTRPILSLDDGTADNQIRLYASGTDLKLTVTTGGVTQADLTLGTVAANTTYKAAFSIRANEFLALMNGGTLQSDTAGTVPVVTTGHIGSDQAGNYQNGHSGRIRAWRQFKSNLYLLV